VLDDLPKDVNLKNDNLIKSNTIQGLANGICHVSMKKNLSLSSSRRPKEYQNLAYKPLSCQTLVIKSKNPVLVINTVARSYF